MFTGQIWFCAANGHISTAKKLSLHILKTRFRWPCSLRRGCAAACLLDCEFEFRGGHGGLSVLSVVCRQVEVSASACSLAQRSPTDCGVSVCDLETSTMRRSRPARAVEP